jgi:methionine-gamma-lyase
LQYGHRDVLVQPADGSARPIAVAAFYIETPANPTNGMVDLEHARKIVYGLHGPDGERPVIVVDNTLLGPIFQTPLADGADLVVTRLLNMSAVIPT